MIIDCEHHFSTEEQLRKRGHKSQSTGRGWDRDGRVTVQRPREAADCESHLAFMDEAGIDMAVLTTNMCGDLEEVRHWNDVCARAVREHPTRFVGLAATMPLGDGAAHEEMERAVRELGMRGVHIQARIQGRHLDSRDLWPFYEKVSELKVPIDVHVEGEPPGCEFLDAPYALSYVAAREFDMCAATLRICLGGVLEEFPDLVFIMNHFGGGVSAIKERIDVYTRLLGPTFYREKPMVQKPWTTYFHKLYFNVAGREVGMDALRCALTNISPGKLVFGTDWPYNFEGNPREVTRYVREIRELGLPAEDIDAILGGNACELLRIDPGLPSQTPQPA